MSKFRLTYAGGKYAGKKIVDLVKSIKRVARNKKSKTNVEKAGQGTKSVKAYNIRAGARNDKMVPIKKQSQKGSAFQTHNVKTPGANSARVMGLSRYGSEGSAASWRADMDRFQEIPISAFLKKKKALGGVASFKRG